MTMACTAVHCHEACSQPLTCKPHPVAVALLLEAKHPLEVVLEREVQGLHSAGESDQSRERGEPIAIPSVFPECLPCPSCHGNGCNTGHTRDGAALGCQACCEPFASEDRRELR